jgi:outer membrane immunogenic protein
MKERPMRGVFYLLMILGAAPPALAAAHKHNRLMLLTFFQAFTGALASALAGRRGTSESALMRLIGVLGLLGVLASPAFAADYDVPVLRGGQVAPVASVGPGLFTRWSGLYVGGMISFNNTTTDFVNATQPLIHFSLRSTTLEQQVTPSGIAVLGKGADSAFGGGAFLGYNTQWQDLVIGVEANYNHTNLNTTAPASAVARIFPSLNNEVALNATGRLDLTDYGEVRFRAGYVVGNLLPYGFIGMVVGGAGYSVTTLADVAQFTPGTSPILPTNPFACIGTGQTIGNAFTGVCQDFLFSNSAGQSNALLWGYSVGAGLDWMVTPNIFVRSEIDFDQFAPITNISMWIFSGRVGAGYKF